MSTPTIPLDWILEHVLKHPDEFRNEFILRLLDEIASNPNQPSSIPSTIIVAFLKRVFSSPDSLLVCNVDFSIEETIDYLNTLERQRTRRIKALEKRGGSRCADFIKSSPNVHKRYEYVVTSIKYWTVYNEISRMPFNPYNALSLIAKLFPEDISSQTQSQESSVKSSPDARRRIELTSLVQYIAKGAANAPEGTYDASKHHTLVKNQNKMPWDKVSSTLLSYLEGVQVLFERSEVWINPERRINGLKIDDKMIQTAAEELQRATGR